MAFCTKCGAQLADGSTFCTFCGSPQTPAQSAQVKPYSVGANYSGGYSGGYVDPNAPIIPGFGEAISICFSKYVSLEGRASRSEFWYWYLFTLLIGWIPLVGGIAGLVCLLPSIAVFVRRMHDTNRSGWWWWLTSLPLFVIIPMVIYIGEDESRAEEMAIPLGITGILWIVFAIVILCFLCAPSTPGPNKYGPAPVRR